MIWRNLAIPTLLTLAALAYGLDRGIFVGSKKISGFNTYRANEPLIQKKCRYLFVTGIVEIDAADGLQYVLPEVDKDGFSDFSPDTGYCRFFAMRF